MPFPVLHRTHGRIELNHLSIQPTNFCQLNCEDCYVKARFTNKLIDPKLLIDLLDWFTTIDEINTNQITMSLNDLPTQKSSFRSRIVDVAEIFLTYRNYEAYHKWQKAITCHSIYTFKEYMEYIGINNINLDILTLSSLPPKDENYTSFLREIKNKNSMTINLNLFEDEYVTHRRSGIFQCFENVIDNINILKKKEPVSLKVDRKAVVLIRDKLVNSINDIDKTTLMTKQTTSIDPCVHEVKRQQRVLDVTSCSANISQLHVHADGKVSGCPYALEGRGTLAKTSEELFNNIVNCLNYRDFQSCTIKHLKFS